MERGGAGQGKDWCSGRAEEQNDAEIAVELPPPPGVFVEEYHSIGFSSSRVARIMIPLVLALKGNP